MHKPRPTLCGLRILCVDDDQDALDLLAAVLERDGAHVALRNSGEAAIAALNDAVFDVIISDLSMPGGIDGYDFAHAMRKLEQNGRGVTPTMALSGDALNPSVKKRFADFQVYMAKPFDRTRLIDIVRRLAEADGRAVDAGSLASYDANKEPPSSRTDSE